jgi:hypothetical protein
LFTEIDEQKNIASIDDLNERAVTAVRDAIIANGVQVVPDKELENVFKEQIIDTGKLPQTAYTTFVKIREAKANFDAGKLTKNETIKIKKSYSTFIKEIVEFIQRKRARDVDRSRIRLKVGQQFGEVLLLGKNAFIIHDLDAEEREISKALLNKDGSLGTPKKSSLEEMEEALTKTDLFDKIFLKEKTFESLKKFFGKDIEILMH